MTETTMPQIKSQPLRVADREYITKAVLDLLFNARHEEMKKEQAKAAQAYMKSQYTDQDLADIGRLDNRFTGMTNELHFRFYYAPTDIHEYWRIKIPSMKVAYGHKNFTWELDMVNPSEHTLELYRVYAEHKEHRDKRAAQQRVIARGIRPYNTTLQLLKAFPALDKLVPEAFESRDPSRMVPAQPSAHTAVLFNKALKAKGAAHVN